MNSLNSCFISIMQLNSDLGKVVSKELIAEMQQKRSLRQNLMSSIVKKVPGSNKTKNVVIDEEEHQAMMKLIKKLMDKNNCYDLFQKAVVGGKRFFEDKPIQKILEYKFNRRRLYDMYARCRFSVSMRSVDNELFVMLLLRSIELSREMFVLEIEQGLETIIPKELS